MLPPFLRDQARRAFVVGEADCALFVADWVRLVTGRDGAAALRGQYTNPAEALRLHGRRGLVGTVGACARSVGLKLTRRPTIGDIAVLWSHGTIYCGIRVARGWAVRADRAIMVLDEPRVVAAWAVPRG